MFSSDVTIYKYIYGGQTGRNMTLDVLLLSLKVRCSLKSFFRTIITSVRLETRTPDSVESEIKAKVLNFALFFDGRTTKREDGPIIVVDAFSNTVDNYYNLPSTPFLSRQI